MKLTLKAGPHARWNCPVIIPAGDAANNVDMWQSEAGTHLPAQHLSNGDAAIIIPCIAANHELILTPVQSSSPTHGESGMHFVVSEPGVLQLWFGQHLITAYRHSNVVRPYFFPVHNPDGERLTRSYPMEDVDGEHRDHHHHKSIWIAHGDVNGTDNWSEEPEHGSTRNLSVSVLEEGPLLARFEANGLWLTTAGEPLLSEHLTVSAWRGNDEFTLLDFDIALTADQTEGDVIFGDTKEGGILSVRVASTMDGRHGGQIASAYGGIGERECWGKPSQFCSYSGATANGIGGIAILERQDSFRAPVTWHVRDYGLMTANPFGYAAFTDGRLDGTFSLSVGKSICFHYRMVLHSIPQVTETCYQLFADYVFPPQITIEQQEVG